MTSDEVRGAFMFASGMGWYAWRLDHQPIGDVVLMVVGVALGMGLIHSVGAWLIRRVREARTVVRR